jgi:hypothetical protein
VLTHREKTAHSYEKGLTAHGAHDRDTTTSNIVVLGTGSQREFW